MNNTATFSTNVIINDSNKVSVEFAELPGYETVVLRVNFGSMVSGLTFFFNTRDEARDFAHKVWGAWTTLQAEQLEILEGAGA